MYAQCMYKIRFISIAVLIDIAFITVLINVIK